MTSDCGRWREPIKSVTTKSYARLLTLVLLAIGIRLLYIDTQPDTSHLASTDAWGYHRLALNLHLGHGFSLRRQAPFEPDGVRTPLYPLFLLLVRRLLGSNPRTVAIVQAALDGVSTLLTYRLTLLLAATLGSNTGQKAGRLAALLYALNPVQVRQVNELFTETLLSCLLLLCLCTLVHYVRLPQPKSGANRQRHADNPALLAIVLGLLSALAALCKPNVQYLPLVWAPAILLTTHDRSSAPQTGSGSTRPQHPEPIPDSASLEPGLPKSKPRWRDAALALTAFSLLLSPWIIRNRVVFGRTFLSTAFQGNVSRVSAPATLLTARGQYALPWSAEWESAFGEIVAEAAQRYRWDQPWDKMNAQTRDRADRQVYLVARKVLARHPLAWVASHLQGTLRHLEPQTYRALYAHWTGRSWPPDILDDALIHTLRAALSDNRQQAGQIVAQERWTKLTPLQRAIWWSTVITIVLTAALVAHGACKLRRHPLLLLAILGTIAYVLLLAGPIAYERFRVPVLGPILALVALSLASPRGICYNRNQ